MSSFNSGIRAAAALSPTERPSNTLAPRGRHRGARVTESLHLSRYLVLLVLFKSDAFIEHSKKKKLKDQTRAPVLTVRSAHEPRVPYFKYRILCTRDRGLTEALAKAA